MTRQVYIEKKEGGGWPRLNSEKRLWVPHPCGFQGAGFDFAIRELETGGWRYR
jgi:hypothetical protein